MKINLTILILSLILLFHLPAFGQGKKILFFASHEQAYYSELIVALKALEAEGYDLDLRSANAQDISCYMVPQNTTINETANSLAGSNYDDFTTQFESFFGTAWNETDNATPAFYPVNGSIHDVVNMNDYEALIIAGGTGILAYRVDGDYQSQGNGDRMLTASEVQATAEKLNSLALDALGQSKPVLAQCHGASLPIFWRIPGTSGTGSESLGFSLLKNQAAAGYPQTETQMDYTSLNVTYNESDRVKIATPHSSFSGQLAGKSKVVTSRDWYPQTVAHASRTLLSILETYPSQEEMEEELKVLIIHGGAVDPNDCSPSNRENDVPCNYGGGTNLPADYTDLLTLFNADSPNDNYQFDLSELNITSASLPFDNMNESSISAYLSQFDALIFYKHWSTGVTDELQNAIKAFVDNGGGILGLHHALYNDMNGGIVNKNILTSELFGAESAMNTWSANLTNYNLFSTNYGHFVSSYGINYSSSQQVPNTWQTEALLEGTNFSHTTYHSFPIFDELYNNMTFLNQEFGREINQVTPILSNDQNPASQVHTSAFVKLFDEDLNGTFGKLAYYEIGERKESLNLNHTFGQVLRNSLLWTAFDVIQETAVAEEIQALSSLKCYPNPVEKELNLILPSRTEILAYCISTISGKEILTEVSNKQNSLKLDLGDLYPGLYFLKLTTNYGQIQYKFIKN